MKEEEGVAEEVQGEELIVAQHCLCLRPAAHTALPQVLGHDLEGAQFNAAEWLPGPGEEILLSQSAQSAFRSWPGGSLLMHMS